MLSLPLNEQPRRAVVRWSTAPDTLLLMGIGGNLDMWQPLERRLLGRQLIMFDFPGTGGSSLEFLPPTMGWNALLVRLLLRRLGLGRVDVLGYSWGGILAQHLAVQHPGSVRRLILVATGVGLGGLPPSPRTASRLVTPRRYYSRSYFRLVAPSLYGGRYRHDPAMVEAHAAQRLARPPSRYGYWSQLAALIGYSTLPALPFINAPTLIVAGDDDPIVPTLNPRLMAWAIRHSKLAVISGAGHLMMVDSPEPVARIVEDFLGTS
jgi:poly(3-hydroxyoctanoate) depolymerase